tara:strand:- start:8344 stop:9024 length:681 start_codon:yes stop_codon:yes gene_type:complete
MDSPDLDDAVAGLFIGAAQPMPNDGRPTGIFKQAVSGPLRIHSEGLEGDVQADRKVHGGVEKALHQFSPINYALMAEHFPEPSALMCAGAMGENISSALLHESNVCIGDVFELGTARVQVAQPRTPCWKIDARFGAEGITRFVAARGIVGWYYRVLSPGEVKQGDRLRLIERQKKTLSLEQFNALTREHRPAIERLFEVAQTVGLNADWSARLRSRAQYLHHNASK